MLDKHQLLFGHDDTIIQKYKNDNNDDDNNDKNNNDYDYDDDNDIYASSYTSKNRAFIDTF